MTKLDELANDVRQLSERINQLTDNVSNEAATAARVSALEQCQALKDSIDERIDKRIKTACALVSMLLVVLGAISYFGLQCNLSSIVKDHLGKHAEHQVQDILTDAERARIEIRQAYTMARRNRLIVLQTDYGTKSPYMGTLMGVIYNLNPQARIQVITAEINNFDCLDAAWTLWRSSRFYPPNTIFVVITNPGGLTSKPVVIVTCNGHMYIGHDNGVFDLVVQNYGCKAAYTIASPELNPPEFRDLFGGVDLFGPTAAKLSLGFDIDKVGPKSSRYIPKLPGMRHILTGSGVVGTVMEIDKFGNATTNITESDIEHKGARIGSVLNVKIRRASLQIPLKSTYGYVSKGEPVALLYEGLLQLAINEGDFRRKYGIQRGDQISVCIE